MFMYPTYKKGILSMIPTQYQPGCDNLLHHIRTCAGTLA